MTNSAGYSIEDLWTNEAYGIMKPNDQFSCNVNPTGVVMIKATVIPQTLSNVIGWK